MSKANISDSKASPSAKTTAKLFSEIPKNLKVSTGIKGLDTILHGGYSRGHINLIRGRSGTGKSRFALLFALDKSINNNKVVYATFDESISAIEGYVQNKTILKNIHFLDFTTIPEILSSGSNSIDLSALLIRIEHAIKKTGAKIMVLDAFDNMLLSFDNKGLVRNEIQKVFQWCREREISLVATTGIAKGYENSTDVMDYASDCTILLQQIMENGLMTRKLRIMKFRGRAHGTNEYPFAIDSDGVGIFPVTDTAMTTESSRKRFKTNIKELDKMLGGKGLLVNTITMISGQSGSGKSLLAYQMVSSALSDGHKVLYISYEEAPQQIQQNAKAFAMDFSPYLKNKKLSILSMRSVELGMEEHVIRILNATEKFDADFVVIDPISSLADIGDSRAFKNVTLRLVHVLKQRGKTVILTELQTDSQGNTSSLNISSISDNWIRLMLQEKDNSMRRLIKVHKTRGNLGSNQIREMKLSYSGLEIEDIVVKDNTNG